MSSELPFYERYPARACVVCGAMARQLLFRQTFLEMSSGSLMQGYDIVVCSGCGFGFADHVPPQADFDAHYRDMSKYELPAQEGRGSVYDMARFQTIAEMLMPLLPGSEARVLEVGCANGQLLAILQEHGFKNVLGLDPSPACVASARTLFGLTVKQGAISDASAVLAHEPRFDGVILIGVLEHIRDVEPELLRLRALMNKDALLLVEVPDATDFARWPDAPYQQFSTEHINFFSAHSLENLMRRLGFVPVVTERVARNQTANTMMPVVSAIYRKSAEASRLPAAYDDATVRGLSDYIHTSQRVDARIQQTIEALVQAGTPIIVWGVGTHTLHLLAASRLAQANIRAFVDSNPHYHNKQLNGIEIISPVQLRQHTEPILISSRVFQPEIQRQLRDELGLDNPVLTLYEA